MGDLKYAIAAAAALIAAAPAAHAACDLQGSGDVNIISNVYPALEVIKSVAESCSHDGLHVTMKLTKQNVAEITQAFSAKTSPFSAAQVANGSIIAVQAAGLLRPLDDLVAKYKTSYAIDDQSLIRYGDQIIAVAFQVNAQHLYYRTDLFDKYHLTVPASYDELLKDLDVLKQEPGIDHPFTASYLAGWDLAEEFTNIFLAEGGQFFKPGTVEPDIASDKGVATLALMQKLLGYMSPNALNIDSPLAAQELEQGKAAVAVLWADHVSQMDDPKVSRMVGKIGFAKAPSAVAGGPPAATLWWDGFVIPKNAPADPDLAFRVVMEALRPEVVAAHNDVTIWLRSNYKPTRFAQGVIQTVQAGAPPYPTTPQQSLIHGALGDHIGDALVGKTTAMQALKASEDSYRQAARDKGLLR